MKGQKRQTAVDNWEICGQREVMLMASARIIVPCYNEEKRMDIASFRSFKSIPHSVQFVFVDDGSTDGTRNLLEALTAEDPVRFSMISLAPNRGKAEAVRQGLLSAFEAHPDYVGFWDADLATPLEAITEFIDLAERHPALELVIGSRVRLLGRDIERKVTRHYLGRIFATTVSIMLSLPVYDTQCGAKLFRVSASAKSLFEKPFLSSWIFDVEILARFIRGRRALAVSPPEQAIYEFPLTVWRDIPGSKLKYADFLRAVWELYRIRQRYFHG